MLICPGGGYASVSITLEGTSPAEFINNLGFDAWVLDYTTIKNASAPLYPTPINEATDALAYIRSQKNLTKLGIWGFSAGGHLAGVTLTTPENKLDFGILAYPVITMEGPYAHKGSAVNLIGANATAELASEMSVQNRVSNSTPPVFLFHTANDATVPIQNTLMFAEAMAKYARRFQVSILPDGGHGLGLALNDPVRSWTPELVRFLKYSI